MDIRLVSSLTREDEDEIAPRILEALRTLLDRMPIAYTIRLETASGRLLQYSTPTDPRSRGRPAPQRSLPSDPRYR